MSAHFICSDRLRLFRLVFKINIANPLSYILHRVGMIQLNGLAGKRKWYGGSCDITDDNATHIWPLPAFPTKLLATV